MWSSASALAQATKANNSEIKVDAAKGQRLQSAGVQRRSIVRASKPDRAFGQSRSDYDLGGRPLARLATVNGQDGPGDEAGPIAEQEGGG